MTRRYAVRLVALLGLYLGLAYLVLPTFWWHFEHMPAMEPLPKTTVAPDGLPGDPLNLALIGREEDVVHAFAAAGWRPADPISLRSALAIAADVVLDRPDADAPVSELLCFGRRQDLAFEKPVGGSPRQRHHVRFWKTDLDDAGGPVWIGAATFDHSVGLSRTTGQITHHIAADVDTERDALVGNLERAGRVTRIFQVTGVGPTVSGRNGGGDRYFTDGELVVAVLAPAGEDGSQPASVLPPPAPVRIKNQFWSWLRPALDGAVDRTPASAEAPPAR
jgi:hypothetical protein